MKFKTSCNTCKTALKLVSPLSITSWNFWEPGFWIPTKGILSHPKVDWPCQDFTQGSTREQPTVQCALCFRFSGYSPHSKKALYILFHFVYSPPTRWTKTSYFFMHLRLWKIFACVVYLVCRNPRAPKYRHGGSCLSTPPPAPACQSLVHPGRKKGHI